MEPEVFCTTIIPTVGRESLSRAVESVLQQELPPGFSLEILVINDSGAPLSVADWQKSGCVQVVTTNHRERSVARNTGAAMAKGQYLHFLDDDDWLAPGAYHNLWNLSRQSSAKWLYGMTQLVDRDLTPTIKLRHNLRGNAFLQAMAGEWIPLQSSLIERKAFMRLGGFNPLLAGPEDIDLLRRCLLVQDLDEVEYIVATVIRGEEGSTTDYSQHAEYSRMAREWILESPHIFGRMRASAGSPFWQGRMLRIYLTSAIWNIRHKRLLAAASRLFSAARCLVTANIRLFHPTYWRSVAGPYDSITFERGLQEAHRIA